MSQTTLIKTMPRKKHHRDAFKLFLFVLPGIAFVFLFSYLPIWGWVYSLFDYKPGIELRKCEYVGIKFFVKLFSNPVYRSNLFRVLKNTVGIQLLSMALSWVTPLFAILLNEMTNLKVKKFVQTMTTLPNFVSWVIVNSLVFTLLSTEGLVNTLLTKSNLIDRPIAFLTSPNHVWIKMWALGTWKGIGWGAVLYLAAINGIDQELYEAAQIDGANRFQQTLHVTVPGLIPTYFVLLVMGIGNFLSVGMEQYLLFSNEMNKDAMEVLDLYVYNQGIKGGQISYSTAISIMKSAVGIILFSLSNYMSKLVRGSTLF